MPGSVRRSRTLPAEAREAGQRYQERHARRKRNRLQAEEQRQQRRLARLERQAREATKNELAAAREQARSPRGSGAISPGKSTRGSTAGGKEK